MAKEKLKGPFSALIKLIFFKCFQETPGNKKSYSASFQIPSEIACKLVHTLALTLQKGV